MENQNREEEPLTSSSTSSFTRYLYVKELVVHSLFLSLLEKNNETALFWAYELYFSGYDTFVFGYLEQVYDMLYKPMNPENVNKYIKTLCDEETINEEKLGILVITIISRPYDINPFIKEFFQIKCVCKDSPTTHAKLFKLKSFDFTPYKTVDTVEHWKIVVEKYPINNQYTQIFLADVCDYLYYLRKDWLSLAFYCPYWKKIIKEYGGEIYIYEDADGNKEYKVEFISEEKEDEFYEKYSFEPDEQSLNIQYACVGNPETQQLTVKDLADKYQGNIVIKRIRNIKKG